MIQQTYGIKYIGSKNTLVGEILSVINTQLGTPQTLRIIDVFTGTSRVGQAFRAQGWQVTSSDLSWASEAYAHAFLIRTAESGKRIPDLITALKRTTPTTDWITRNYCDVSGTTGLKRVRMWKPENGMKADAMRQQIAEWVFSGFINNHESMILIACLIFALDKVDSSTGVQQAYLKDWSSRASNPLILEDLPYYDKLQGNHIVGNCLTADYLPADVAYLDPPYSAHSYSTYYHIWDSITRWDKPAVYLKTNRRADRVSGNEAFDVSMQSEWNRKSTALAAFLRLCARLPVRHILISYSNESLIPLSELVEGLRQQGNTVTIKEIPYKRNIMSQIGNAALSGEEHSKMNKEALIWATKSSA